jgi:hypothetical protein
MKDWAIAFVEATLLVGFVVWCVCVIVELLWTL